MPSNYLKVYQELLNNVSNVFEIFRYLKHRMKYAPSAEHSSEGTIFPRDCFVNCKSKVNHQKKVVVSSHILATEPWAIIHYQWLLSGRHAHYTWYLSSSCLIVTKIDACSLFWKYFKTPLHFGRQKGLVLKLRGCGKNEQTHVLRTNDWYVCLASKLYIISLKCVFCHFSHFEISRRCIMFKTSWITVFEMLTPTFESKNFVFSLGLAGKQECLSSKKNV